MSSSEERELLSRIIRTTLSKNPDLGTLLEEYSFREIVGLTRELLGHFQTHGDRFLPAQDWEAHMEGQRKRLLSALKELQAVDLKELPEKTAEKISVLKSLAQPLQELGRDYEKIRQLFLESLENISKPPLREGRRGYELKSIIDFIFELKKEIWDSETWDPLINQRHSVATSQLQILIQECEEKILKEKSELGVLTFDDLEFLSLKLVENHPNVIKSIREEWDFWFIDEFQDTSPLQKKLLFYFFRKPWNAYFVGDPQQSIYLFRGADERVFQDTKIEVQAQNGSVEKLQINYRSQPDLLKFMNLIFTSLKSPPLTQSVFVSDVEGQALETMMIEPLLPHSEERGEIRGQIYLAGEGVLEENLVLEQIKEWLKHGFSFQDIAILTRTNDKGRELARMLSSAGVPVYVHASGGYFDRREVLDALSLLSFIEDPSEDETFVILARSPWMALPDGVLASWGLQRNRLSFWEWLTLNPEELEKFESLRIVADAMRKAETRPLSSVFEEALERLGFFEFCLTGDASGRREANLRKLLFKLKSEEAQLGFSASRFLDEAWQELNEFGDEGEASSFIEPERVNIMTIHKSKGLKFNCVIIPSCSEPLRTQSSLLELAPDGRWAVRVLALESEEKVSPIMHVKLKEERAKREFSESLRVFYVAVTRAAERICLIGSEKIQNKSWLSQFHLDLTEGTHENCYKVKKWIENPPLPKREEILGKLVEDEPRPLQLKQPMAKKTTQLSVTQLVSSRLLEGRRSSLVGVAAFRRQLEAQQRGQAIHFIFEQLKLTPEYSVKELCKMAVSRFGPYWDIREERIQATLDLLTPPLKKILDVGLSEWPFVIRENDITLKGQIDLWGSFEDGTTWIIDYKSAATLDEESLRRAWEQLELYALAIEKAGRSWDSIRLAVVQPMAGTAQEVALSPREKVLERLTALDLDQWGDTDIYS